MAKLKINKNYGIIPNEILNNTEISFKAKGLFAYIQSKPDGWDFSAERISVQTNEGLTSVRTGLKELENAGYLLRRKFHNEYGFFEIEYVLSENPFVENPTLDNPTSVNPTSENHTNNSNKDLSKKERQYITLSNKENSNILERKQQFYELLNNYSDQIGNEFDKFFEYWTEPSKSGKMRFEMEKFFDISRRIGTWNANASKYKGKHEANFNSIKKVNDDLINDIKNGTFYNPFSTENLSKFD